MSFLQALIEKAKQPFLKKTQTGSNLVDLSYSRIQTYQRCPWMYHLVYVLGWRSGPKSGTALGMSLHRTLAAYHASANQEKTLERLMEIYDEVWVNEGFNSTQETLDAYDNGRKMLEQFFKTDQSRVSEIVDTEKEFAVVLNDQIQFHGTVDRLDRYADGTYEIVEYKTHSQHWTENRMESDLQMTLYELGLKKTLDNASVKLKYHFLSSGECLSVKRTPNQIQAAEKLMNDIANRIRKNDFAPNFDYCAKCEFASRCSNYRKQPASN